jgi:hypothetical protein
LNDACVDAVADEGSELFYDKAEGILREALESENELRRDVAARFVLNGKGARRESRANTTVPSERLACMSASSRTVNRLAVEGMRQSTTTSSSRHFRRPQRLS